MRFNYTNLQGGCGIRNLYGFGWGDRHTNLENGKAGSGLYVANFLDTSNSKVMYEILTKKYKLLYQSPVRRNYNSDNLGFFCVFGDKDRY